MDGDELVVGDSMPQDQLNGLTDRLATAFLLRHVAERAVTDQQLGLADASQDYAVVKATIGAPPPVVPAPRRLQAAPTPRDSIGAVLLTDDLSAPHGDHLPLSSPDAARYSAGYVDGQYEIAVDRPAGQGEAIVSGTYDDAAISVDAELVNPTPAQYVQLACRSQNQTSQYRFAFRPATGEYWLTRSLSQPALINSQTNTTAIMVPPGLVSPAVHLGSASNRPELRCRGTTIEARINGELLATVLDNTFTSGQMWIATGQTASASPSAPKTVAHFRNLILTQR